MQPQDMTGETATTILDQFANHGVNVNGLIVPGRSVEAVLARHAINLVVNNNDEAFKLYLSGSRPQPSFGSGSQGQTSWRRVTVLLSTKNCETKKPGFFGFIDSVISPLTLSPVVKR